MDKTEKLYVLVFYIPKQMQAPRIWLVYGSCLFPGPLIKIHSKCHSYQVNINVHESFQSH